LFTQEINVKEDTFGISSSSTSREDHEARQSLHGKDSSLNHEENDVKGPHASAQK
jgi:hypothetical protein